jgi:hypothetical protein
VSGSNRLLTAFASGFEDPTHPVPGPFSRRPSAMITCSLEVIVESRTPEFEDLLEAFDGGVKDSVRVLRITCRSL